MIDWRDETNEGHSIDRFYDKRHDAEVISVDDALQFVAESASQQ